MLGPTQDEHTTADLSAFGIYESGLPKFRLGGPNDGGYVVVDMDGGYDLLLSAGVGGDIRFEVDFLDRYEIKGVAFDPGVDRLPAEHPRLGLRGERATSSLLASYLENYTHVFLKMDIEGDEYDLFEGLSEDLMSNIKQMVVEFHNVERANHIETIGKLSKTHVFLHAHGNNCCGTHVFRPPFYSPGGVEVYDGEVELPNLLEITAVRAGDVKEFWPRTEPMPTGLDWPNLPGKPEIKIDGWPFVSRLS